MNSTQGTNPAVASFTELLDLASEKAGGKALECSDDFFAPMQSMLKASAPIFIADKYVDTGKWMDGWESRRKRNLAPGNDHDWCVVQLGIPGIVRGVNVDTAFFTGNYPEYCSIEASNDGVKWVEILAKSKLQGNTQNLFAIAANERFTHIKLRIFPDGGVARFRVHGEAKPDLAKLGQKFDLIAAANGGVVISASDMHYGAKDNLILPGRAAVMGEGWETKRRRGPGYDWIIVKTATSGKIQRLEIDTNHFKGNFPESASIEVLSHPARDLQACDFRDRKDLVWKELLPRTKLQAHHQHYFDVSSPVAADYVRLNIYPDGGISRFRAEGVKA